ncbi:hypothetical protein [Nonomuraea fuscirosea]|uniref:hypothetical protein n=1 Tax=Nonomuraea fuscirosea TaxID=1291556 RepID=UPI00342CE0D6
MWTRALTACLLAMAGLFALPVTPARSAPATQPVTVRIMSVECEHCTDEGLEDAGKGAPDFYAKISIGSQTFTTPRAPDDRTKVFVPEGWTMTQQVSTSLPSVDISVQIWDADVFPDPNGDDLADSTPRPDDATSRFKLDLVDGSLSGDLTSSNQCLLGNGEEDQPPVQVCFDVRPYSFEDGDGDGFTDYAEHRGLDFNGDGRTTLRWKPGTVAPGASATVTYTARTSLLTTGGTVVTTRATLRYGGAGGCAYPDVTATADSTVTERPPGRDPRAKLVWQLRESDWTPDLLARTQATDQRYDGADGSAPDGALSKAEVRAALLLPLLRGELLATYLNLADRRINAATRIVSVPAALLDLTSVGQAAGYARSALQDGDLLRQTKATVVLNEINLNLSERY